MEWSLAALAAAVVIPVIHALMIRLSNKKLVLSSSTFVAFGVYLAIYFLIEYYYIGMSGFTMLRFIAGLSTLSFIMFIYM